MVSYHSNPHLSSFPAPFSLFLLSFSSSLHSFPPFSPTVLTRTYRHLDFHLSSPLVIDFRLCYSASRLAPHCERAPAERQIHRWIERKEEGSILGLSMERKIMVPTLSFFFTGPLLLIYFSFCLGFHKIYFFEPVFNQLSITFALLSELYYSLFQESFLILLFMLWMNQPFSFFLTPSVH